MFTAVIFYEPDIVLTYQTLLRFYTRFDDHISILYKDGTIKDITEASEILNISLLSKKICKYYLCYQRF